MEDWKKELCQQMNVYQKVLIKLQEFGGDLEYNKFADQFNRIDSDKRLRNFISCTFEINIIDDQINEIGV